MTFSTSYLVFDYEVTVRCPVGSNKANPHWPGNLPVCLGYKDGTSLTASYVYSGMGAHLCVGYTLERFNESKVLVGHNLPFDLQWLMRDSGGSVDLADKTLWDTALAEYVLSGQQSKMPSLDTLCVKYGLPVKDDRIKKMWEAGVDTIDIPSAMLTEYCSTDVVNTEQIFLRQLKESKEKGCLKLILVLNDALLAITMMMHNGMKVDHGMLDKLVVKYTTLKEEAEFEFRERVKGKYKFKDFNLNSPKHLSTLLYGGELVEESKEPVGHYKTGIKAGQKKYKTVHHTVKFPGVVNKSKIEELKIEKTTHGYSTNDESLQKLRELKVPYIEEVLSYRTVEKQLSTYFIKTQSLLFPDWFIYHNINPTVTETGRYSSSEPNLQNVTSGSVEEPSEIKRCYISRYGEDGAIVEMDFQQLEMVALAQLSKDRQLINDINDGIDIHTTLYRSLFHKIPSKEERKQFKRASFALIYGAGPKKIAQAAGISFSEAKRFIQEWGVRYPSTVHFWASTHNKARRERVMSDLKDAATGKPLGISKLKMSTGRILTFKESVAPWDGSVGISPNETKNYPIQSFATGDLVPLFLGKLVREVLSPTFRELTKGQCVLVNTVHDSVELDCRIDALPHLKKVLKNVSANMNRYIFEEFGIKMELELKSNVTYGSNWFDQEGWNLDD